MGAPTTNRKRSRFPFLTSHLDSASQPVSKKPKPSLPLFDWFFRSPMPSQTTLSRVRQYPAPQSLKREVHAPCQSLNFTNPTLSCLFYPRFQHHKTLDKKEKVSVVDDSSVEEVQILSSSDRSKKTLGFFPNNRTVVRSKEPPHRKLYEPTTKPASKLSFLAHIEFLIKKLTFFVWSSKKSDKDLVKEAFLELTNNEKEEVSQAFSSSNRYKVLVTHSDSNIEITGEVLQCLRPGVWLNDEVINLYLELLKEREKREPEKFLKCHFFNTFFYKKLISGKDGYDFKAVKRWTTQRKIGYSLIECDKIFVPIHKDTHWCLAVINRKDEKFQYLDSLKGKDSTVLEVLARYYVDEVKDKSAKDIDVNTWKVEYVSNLPEQKNWFDCGVFMIKYADFYSRGLGLCFDQKHMRYFRKRTAKEILRLKAE